MSPTPDPDSRRRLKDAVRAIPQVQRQIFLAHRVDRLSYDEIARRMGLTTDEVERHMAKAIYKLHKQLDGRRLSFWERWF